MNLFLVFVLIPVLIFSAGEKVLDYIKPLEVSTSAPGIEGIDCIYCINLDIRKEKWNAMQARFAKEGIAVQRVSAVNGWTDISKQDLRKLKAPCKARLRPGQIGCFISHLSILQDAAKRQFKRILILEDDVEFTSTLKDLDKYLEVLTRKDPEWDLLFIDEWRGQDYGIYHPVDRPRSRMSEIIQKPKEAIVSSMVSRLFYRHGMYAYVVSQKGAQKLLNHFAQQPLELAIDIEMNHIEGVRMYETAKNFVKVSIQTSDTGHKPRKPLFKKSK